MKDKRRFIGLIFLVVANATLLFSQEEANLVDPVIELPPVLLELEDKMVENVKTALPKTVLPEIDEIQITLPQIENPEIDLGVLLPDGEDLVVDEDAQETGHYFDIKGGVGSLASLYGELIWYYASASGLSSKVNLSHDSSHFWNYLPFSENGQERREYVGVEVDYVHGKNLEDFAFSFTENQLWLQNKVSAFDSITWRNLSIDNKYDRDLREGLSLKTRLGMESFFFTENYGDALKNKTFFVPGIGLSLKRDELDFNINADYRMGAVDHTFEHFFKFLMDFSVPLPENLKFDGAFGLFWSNDEHLRVYDKDFFGLSFPFYVGLSGSPFDFFQFKIGGGFREWEEDYLNLQEELKWMGWSSLKMDQGWYFLTDLIFPIKEIATLSAGLEYRNSSNLVSLGPLDLGLIELTQGKGETLFLSAGVEVNPSELVELKLNWRGEVLSQLVLPTPEHRLEAELNYHIPEKWFGGSFDFKFDYYEEARIPEVGAGIYFVVKEKYKIKIEAKDLFARIYGKTGRPSRGIFMEEGTRVAFLFEISL